MLKARRFRRFRGGKKLKIRLTNLRAGSSRRFPKPLNINPNICGFILFLKFALQRQSLTSIVKGIIDLLKLDFRGIFTFGFDRRLSLIKAIHLHTCRLKLSAHVSLNDLYLKFRKKCPSCHVMIRICEGEFMDFVYSSFLCVFWGTRERNGIARMCL